MSKMEHGVDISSRELATWLDSQPGTWWTVDGDPLLMSEVDFPCPSDELAEAVRKLNKDVVVFTKTRARKDLKKASGSADLDGLADTKNPRLEKNILAAWKGSDIQWLLTEDKSMAEACASRRNGVDGCHVRQLTFTRKSRKSLGTRSLFLPRHPVQLSILNELPTQRFR